MQINLKICIYTFKKISSKYDLHLEKQKKDKITLFTSKFIIFGSLFVGQIKAIIFSCCIYNKDVCCQFFENI
jgi:hypothetical protein